MVLQYYTSILLYYNLTGRPHICGPSLTETSVCCALPYCWESGIQGSEGRKLRRMLTTVRRNKELPAELRLLSYFLYFRSILLLLLLLLLPPLPPPPLLLIYPFQVRARDFSPNAQIVCGAHPASHSTVTGVLFAGLNNRGPEVHHSPPSSTEVKNEWSCTSVARMSPRDSLTF